MTLPPPLPPDCAYTACYCEENVYLLATQFVDHHEACVLVISNSSMSTALWRQKAARGANAPVVWDYHVVLVLSVGGSVWAYDFDTTLSCPCVFEEYMRETFLDQAALPERFRSAFRIVPAREFLLNFASDRSHMLLRDTVTGMPTPLYVSPPPLYAPLVGEEARRRGVLTNLTDLIAMEQGRGFGVVVLSTDALRDWVLRWSRARSESGILLA